jgi:hypothetical protein
MPTADRGNIILTMNYLSLRIIRGQLGDRPVTLHEICKALPVGIAPK